MLHITVKSPQQAPKSGLIMKPWRDAGWVQKKMDFCGQYKVSLVRAYEILPFIWPCWKVWKSVKSHFYAKKKSHFDGNVWSYNEFVIFLGMRVEMKCDNFIIHIHDCSSSEKPLHRKHIPDLFHIIALSHLQLIMLN